MFYYITMEDMVSNAFIEGVKHSKNHFLSYETIERYGYDVVNYLKKKGEKAVLVLSRSDTVSFLENNSSFFYENIMDNERGICLRDGVSVEKLIEEFRGALPLDVLLAFTKVNLAT